MGKGKIKGVNNCRQRNDSSISIVEGGINLISVGEGVGRGKVCTSEDFPNNIKVL